MVYPSFDLLKAVHSRTNLVYVEDIVYKETYTVQ